MAPSRKKGGGKAAAAAARKEWKVGDLVLAKVRGFPAWPAAVSEPKEWGYSADWKKVLVHFFGTQQIAFCNPADVESFTEEKKQSLLTKRHAKGSDFARAIKEITESYEKLKQQDRPNDPKSAEETTVGSSGNTAQVPHTCENLISSKHDTEIKSNSSHGRDQSTLLSEDASAAEQMLALRHNALAHNGVCDSAAARDLCEIATYSSRKRNERVRALKCSPKNILLSVQHSKISSSSELDGLQRSILQCSDGGQSVDGVDDRAIRRRKRIQRSGHSESDDLVSSALSVHGSDEENTSEIATVESDNNSRNEGNGVDSGSKVKHSDAVGEGFDGGHQLNKGLDFQISTAVKRKKRKATRKRETNDLVDPPVKVEAEEDRGANAFDNCQISQSSHGRLDERPYEVNGDEHLPLVKRARVRMRRAFEADEKVNASSQLEEKSSRDTLISAAVPTSPSVNHENDIVSGHGTVASEEFNSVESSTKLPGVMVDVMASHMVKSSDRMSPARADVRTTGDRETSRKFHENEFTMTRDDEVSLAQSSQLSSLVEGKAHVPEVVPGCYEESQTRNCLNSETGPIDVECSRLLGKNETPLNPDTVDSSANKSSDLCPNLDMTMTGVPAQSTHQHQIQEYDSCYHSLVIVRDSHNEKCENIDHCMTQVVSQVVQPPLFCSAVNYMETENTLETKKTLETESTLLKENQGNQGKELDSDKQAHMIQDSGLSATESEMIVEKAEPQYETAHMIQNPARSATESEMIVEEAEPQSETAHMIQNPALSATESEMIVEEAEPECETAHMIKNPALSATESEMIVEEAEPQYETAHMIQNPALSATEYEMIVEEAEPQYETAHIIQNPALSATECEMIVEEAEPQYENVDSHCEDAVENRELKNSCEVDEQKEQMHATNSVLVSENLSREKLSSSPANDADSPATGTPHCNSVSRISTSESANAVQNNSNHRTNVQFGEAKSLSLNDDTVKEESKVETGAPQVKKVISSDVQFTIETFETALGSLVRTKETIGHATRLAMDLAKFGVSAKAMGIIAHTLESESNLQRRVDLFFLVDSIAQCSKGLNGDAGGAYLSSIQAMLPRLLAAAVPAGATTQENRKLCLKVLRVWLERRILPESVVRHHIKELDSVSNVPACLYSRRSARTERSLDDPVRDMEGMLVDEYGSNSTLQLHGFCMPAMLQDEDEGSDSDDGDFESVTPEHESRNCEEHVTPSVTERHTHILEDVDGELEMEDVAPPWETGSSAITDRADNTESANCQPISGISHQNVTSSSPPAPPQSTHCAMPEPSSNGFDCRRNPSMHGHYPAGPPRMNPPMRYGSPESSYSSREGSNIQHRPYPSSHYPPPPSHHYSYVESDHQIKSRREGPSYPHRSHYTPEFDERNYHDSHERTRPGPCENRDNWRYHPPSSHGPRYHDRHKVPYQSSSYNGHHHDSGRFQNHRWSHSPRAYNNRRSFH